MTPLILDLGNRKEPGLLPPGPLEIALYGDGSFSCEAQAGAWAAHAPALGLHVTGIGRGCSSEQFELLALLEGMRSVLAIDHTARPLNLHTDSDITLTVVRCLSTRSELPARKSFDCLRELYAHARNVIGTRSMHASKARTGSPFHRVCHCAARRALRAHVRILLVTDFEVRLRYEECRRKQCLLELEKLRGRTSQVEDSLGGMH